MLTEITDFFFYFDENLFLFRLKIYQYIKINIYSIYTFLYNNIQQYTTHTPPHHTAPASRCGSYKSFSVRATLKENFYACAQHKKKIKESNQIKVFIIRTNTQNYRLNQRFTSRINLCRINIYITHAHGTLTSICV